MMAEHERVILTTDLPDHSLRTGDIGTIVHVYGEDRAYEVEFFTVDGETLDVVTLDSSYVRPADSQSVLHARQMVA